MKLSLILIGIILLFSAGTFAQVSVKGKVISADDQLGIPGVNVVVKGTTIGTITNIDGEYEIEAENEDDVLVFSFISYQSKEVNIDGKAIINVTLEEKVKGLEEVVVVGYGTQRKKVVTGSISSISEEDIERVPVAGLDQALQGRAAGVMVTQNSNAPGGAVSVRIRGIHSANGGNEPLYVIDGVPVNNNNLRSSTLSGGEISGPMNSLNPSDIASIEILKDASAAAIYGSRAAGGVVLITTKQGKAGKDNISFEAYYGIQSIDNKLELTNSAEFVELMNESLYNIGRKPNDEYIDPSVFTETTDWQDRVYQVAPMQNYSLTFNGGTEKNSYYLSTSYFSQEGIIISSKFDRMSLRLNTTNKVSDKLTVGNNFTVSRTNDEFVHTNDVYHGVITATLAGSPLLPVYDEDGNYSSSADERYAALYENPVTMALERDQNLITHKIFGNVYGIYEIIPKLKYKLSAGTDLSFASQHDFQPGAMKGFLNETSVLSEYRKTASRWLIENTLSYNTTINASHNFSFLAGTSTEEWRYNEVSATSQVYDNNFPLMHPGFIDEESRQGSGWIAEDVGYVSFFGRVSYDYEDKYLLTANFRRDGSTKFGPQSKFGNFPSISIGWNLAEEAFLVDIEFIEDAKIRAGYGQVGGSTEIPDFMYLPLIDGSQGYGFGNEYHIGRYPRGIENPKLQWESSEQINFGADIAMFKNKLLFNADYFIKNTNDMLIRVPVPGFLGVEQNPFLNAGSVQNKGCEFELSYRKHEGKFNFDLSANISSFKNEVVMLENEEAYIDMGISRTQVGHPIAEFYGYQVEKIFQTQEEIDVLNSEVQRLDADGNPRYNTDGDPLMRTVYYQSKKTAPGDIMFKDISGPDDEPDGEIDSYDRTFIGSPHPDFTYGFSGNCSFKGIDFNFVFNGVYGNEVYNTLRRNQVSMVNGFNSTKEFYNNRWTEENPSETTIRIAQGDPNQNLQFSDYWLEDGSYLRLRSVSLGYTVPAKITRKVDIQKLRLYVLGKNLFTLTNYSGYDPDIGSYRRSPLTIGVDNGSYPLARTIMFGVNIEF